MLGGHLAFILLSINPIGGTLASIPYGLFALKYPAWLTVVAGAPLAYVQVLVVDLLWSTLDGRRLLHRAAAR